MSRLSIVFKIKIDPVSKKKKEKERQKRGSRLQTECNLTPDFNTLFEEEEFSRA